MLIGVPKEIKNHEERVGLIPSSVVELVNHGHEVIVQSNAGKGINFSDADYIKAGAKIVKTADEIFFEAEMVVKVKEPLESEYKFMREGLVLFTYLHLAAAPQLTKVLVQSKCTAVAYETVTSAQGGLPLLAPMSEVAGRLSVQAGAHYLEKPQKGSGILLGGVAGVCPGKIVVLGGGVVGTAAARMAIGLEADVTIVDASIPRLSYLSQHFGSKIKTIYSTHDAIRRLVQDSDLVIGAVLLPGASAPKLVTREMISTMRKGSVVVDVSIDQGGCFATSKPTSHDDPVYAIDGVIHYCVANMPAAVANTSSIALNNATLPFVLHIANRGLRTALKEDPHLRNGLNVDGGEIINPAVIESMRTFN